MRTPMFAAAVFGLLLVMIAIIWAASAGSL